GRTGAPAGGVARRRGAWGARSFRSAGGAGAVASDPAADGARRSAGRDRDGGTAEGRSARRARVSSAPVYHGTDERVPLPPATTRVSRGATAAAGSACRPRPGGARGDVR